jgi:competence ComEA-like helix-hairpin-helix protein
LKKESTPKNRKDFFIPAVITLLLAMGMIAFYLFSSRWGIHPSEKGQSAWVAYLSVSQESSANPSLPLPESLPGASKLALGQKIDINQASIEDLVPLPGIGPKMAEKIVQDRKIHGPFKTVGSLTRIKGIKEKKLARLRPYIAVKAP